MHKISHQQARFATQQTALVQAQQVFLEQMQAWNRTLLRGRNAETFTDHYMRFTDLHKIAQQSLTVLMEGTNLPEMQGLKQSHGELFPEFTRAARQFDPDAVSSLYAIDQTLGDAADTVVEQFITAQSALQSQQTALASTLQTRLMLWGGVLVGLALLLGFLATQRRDYVSERLLLSLRRHIRALSVGEFHSRVDVEPTSPLSDLASEVNRMAEELSGQIREVQATSAEVREETSGLQQREQALQKMLQQQQGVLGQVRQIVSAVSGDLGQMHTVNRTSRKVVHLALQRTRHMANTMGALKQSVQPDNAAMYSLQSLSGGLNKLILHLASSSYNAPEAAREPLNQTLIQLRELARQLKETSQQVQQQQHQVAQAGEQPLAQLADVIGALQAVLLYVDQMDQVSGRPQTALEQAQKVCAEPQPTANDAQKQQVVAY